MASMSGCSPVIARPAVLAADDASFRAEVIVDPAEPVLAGHYPGSPVFPGVCLVEHVRLAALAVLPDASGGWRLAAVESCRFLKPALPGETLLIDASWTAGGNGRGCTAALTSERGIIARIRLRLEQGDPQHPEGERS